MMRRVGLVIVLSIFLSAISVPVSARALDLVSWQIRVKVCPNGFTVIASGGTTPAIITTIRADQAEALLPNDKPPFIQLFKTLSFTSATGSMLVASAGDPNIQVIGTGNFYFTDPVAPGSSVQLTIGAYLNGTPMNFPNGRGIFSVQECSVPPPEVQADILSGVIIDPQVVGNPLWGDGRASPSPTDQVVIYCLSKGPFAGFIVVNSLKVGENPSRLGQFSSNEVWAIRPKGISKPALNNRGTLSLSVNAAYKYALEWIHGAGELYVKLFSCNIDKSYYNKTENQLLYPDAFGSDGRVAPYPTDKLIVYCRVEKTLVDVWASDFESKGYPLTSFKYDEVRAAIPNPLIHKLPGQGTVSLQVDYDDNFFLKWIGGPWKDDQIKAFKCRF